MPSADLTDALLTQPYIDTDEWRDHPVRHRYLHGGFKGTDALFSMYFPPKEQYQGRFFHPIGAVSGDENTAQRPPILTSVTQENSTIGFAVASGGYLVESNLGAKTMYPLPDHTIEGYRTSAAVARYSRILAAQMYGGRRAYGYVYGGSGGSFKTISGFENAPGVWDGAVPYVTGSPMSMPNVFTVQAHALRILKEKLPGIVDALDPGGSGDMYAGLNDEERAALLEVTRMGLPPRTWFAYQRLGYGPLSVLIDYIVQLDPTYFEEFWKVPGYLGANPPESLRLARIQHKTRITKIVMSDEARKMHLPTPMASWGTNVVPAAFQLAEMPKGDLLGASLIMKSGGASGKRVGISGAAGDLILIGIGQGAFGSVNQIKVGDDVQVDNSIYLAAQTYHRHQVPSRDYYVWDQFRGADGKPIYPQRPKLLGPIYQEMGCGSQANTGKWPGRMIIVEAMVDEYAYPWQADWYRSRVKEVLGDQLDDRFRLWFVDNSMHGGLPYSKADGVRIAGYLGVLQQALRDLSAWVERGVPPPESTSYKIVDGQVEIPPSAEARKGIQPDVTLTANGGARANVKAGEVVNFFAAAEVPSGTGKIVSAEWDFDGTGDYAVHGEIIAADSSGERATVKTSHAFSKAGTYFPVVRVASQREGDAKTLYGRCMNLDRVRVVVT